MAEQDVISNQKAILENQETILSNQKTIVENQEIIKKNQASLDAIALPLGPAIVLVLLWALVAKMGVLHASAFPAPVAVAAGLGERSATAGSLPI